MRSYDKKWIYWSLLIDEQWDKHIVENQYIEQDWHHIRICSDEPMFFEQETVWQYTWLKDKKWKKIYEGDIVDVHWDSKWIVKFWYYDQDWSWWEYWPTNCLWFYVEKIWYKWSAYYTNSIVVSEPTVIWNIYENPELITNSTS